MFYFLRESFFFWCWLGKVVRGRSFPFLTLYSDFEEKFFFSLWQNLNGLIAFRWLIVGVGENSIFRIAAESFAKDIHQSLFSGWKYCLDENFRIDIQMYSTFFLCSDAHQTSFVFFHKKLPSELWTGPKFMPTLEIARNRWSNQSPGIYSHLSTFFIWRGPWEA